MAIVQMRQASQPRESILQVESAQPAGSGPQNILGGKLFDGGWKEASTNMRVDTDLPEQWTASGVGHAYAPGRALLLLVAFGNPCGVGHACAPGWIQCMFITI